MNSISTLNQRPDFLGETHEVTNQPAALEDYNAYTGDPVLQHWVNTFGGEWGEAQLGAYGAGVGGPLLAAGFAANHYKPEFNSHDRFGHRVDNIEFHPGYHQLMHFAKESGHHSLPWRQPGDGANVIRAAMLFMHTYADPGSNCPLSMTFASVPALRHEPGLQAQWIDKILTNEYDPRNVPFFEKNALTVGMAMTEKQGGSDVRANTTVAHPLGEDNGIPAYELVGHKWFCSAPMCDGFLVLAQTDKGMGCFLVPRWRPDGSKNPIQVQRLKDKAGNVSNASSEVELRGAFGWRVGAEGKGMQTILQMVSATRFDCMVSSAALMNQAAREALFHTSGRDAFGKRLHKQPMMQNVLADLALEAEAALALAMRVGHAMDRAPQDAHEASFLRIATAIGKYWICKRAPQHTYEAMESIGAVGVIEDNVAARLYREAPINAIWEGSGNIQCLDVLRVLQREPEAYRALQREFAKVRGRSAELDRLVDDIAAQVESARHREYNARSLVEHFALALQASILLDKGDSEVASSFIQSRIAGVGGHMYGTLPDTVNCNYLVDRALPRVHRV
ncbi:acyl-CoA dehydrogenase family protein [Parahaliea mediterranea]|uniref:acyl-CoA dehydrogenase family protein n=1 Tax=Parahaliea mediterranea TaxID=651086 RepID=UPI000E2F055F|nr:acyl-CoA dehydrogenase family protein [Parahaliea mediterranea]